jgi:hypothetical protein
MNNALKTTALFSALAVGTALLGGCTDAEKAALSNLGEPAKVQVYSGGKKIYEGVSSGKIQNESNSDGYYFNDKCIEGDNKLVEVSGDVVITRNDLSCPAKLTP